MKSRAGLCARRSAVGTEADPTHDQKGPVFARMSFAPAGDSWRKTTRRRYSYGGHASHVEMVWCPADFFAQSSVLSTHYLSIDHESASGGTPETFSLYAFQAFGPASFLAFRLASKRNYKDW